MKDREVKVFETFIDYNVYTPVKVMKERVGDKIIIQANFEIPVQGPGVCVTLKVITFEWKPPERVVEIYDDGNMYSNTFFMQQAKANIAQAIAQKVTT